MQKKESGKSNTIIKKLNDQRITEGPEIEGSPLKRQYRLRKLPNLISLRTFKD